MNINTVHAAMMKTAAGYDREGNYIPAELDKTDVRRGQTIPSTTPAEKAKRLQQINEASLQNPYTANRSIPVDTTPDAPWAKGYENATGITEELNSPYNMAMGQKYEEINKNNFKENPTLDNFFRRLDWKNGAAKREEARKKQIEFDNNMWAASQNVPDWVRDHYLNMNHLLPPGGYTSAVRSTMPPYQGRSIWPVADRMAEWEKEWAATPQGQAFEQAAKARGMYQ